MNTKLVIRNMEEKDILSVVKIVRTSFTTDVLSKIIYGCEGIEKYLLNQIDIPKELTDTTYLVAELEDKVVGYIELKHLNDSLFLNYIAVDRDYKSHNIGKSMLKEAIRMCENPNDTSMVLDVFEFNNNAKSWYSKLGFQEESRSVWWSVVPQKRELCGEKVILAGFPQASACHKEFGFSQFNLISKDNNILVGMIGKEWFRVNKTDILRHTDIINALLKIDSFRQILLITNNEEYLENNNNFKSNFILESIRMKVDLKTLKENLFINN